MKIKDFKLERLFAEHEFSAKYLLSSSDCDGFEMSYVLDKATEEELQLWNKLTLGYTESEGHHLLREALRPFYGQISADNMVVASPGELNFVLMNVLLEKEDHVISVCPGYQSLFEVVRSIGCELSFWKPEPENWKFDIGKLKSLVRKNTKLIIINFPHNPTGSYLSAAEQEELIALARKHDLYIFSDEMYHKLMVGDTKELPPLCTLYEKGISLWGTSKTFGLAGLRIGWMVSEDKALIDKIIAFKDYLSICSSAPSEILSLIAVNHIEKFLEPNLNKIKNNIKLFTDFVRPHQDVLHFIPPQSGSTAFVKLNIDISSYDFTQKLIEESSVMTVPAEMFEYEGKYIRIGFGRENFSQSLKVFDDFLKK